jgi:hypothetical protein
VVLIFPVLPKENSLPPLKLDIFIKICLVLKKSKCQMDLDWLFIPSSPAVLGRLHLLLKDRF